MRVSAAKTIFHEADRLRDLGERLKVSTVDELIVETLWSVEDNLRQVAAVLEDAEDLEEAQERLAEGRETIPLEALDLGQEEPESEPDEEMNEFVIRTFERVGRIKAENSLLQAAMRLVLFYLDEGQIQTAKVVGDFTLKLYGGDQDE